MASNLGRVVGVDVARGVALLSMFVAHTAPSPGPFGVLNLSEFATAPLFAFLIGAGAFFSSERMNFPQLFASSVVRAIAFIALGLYLEGWGAQVDIVLPYLGVLSLLMAPLVFAPGWVLALVAAASWWFALILKTYFLPAYGQVLVEGGYQSYLYQWLFTGTSYQVVTLLCYACVGAVLARALEEWGLVGDAVLAVAATGVSGMIFWYSRTAVAEFLPYTSSRLEMGFALALCLAVVGWCCLLARVLAGREGLLEPLAVAGRMTLSLYVLQIGLLALYSRYAPSYGWSPRDDSWWVLAGLVVLSVAFALVWSRLLGATFLRRGPLETPLALVSGRG